MEKTFILPIFRKGKIKRKIKRFKVNEMLSQKNSKLNIPPPAMATLWYVGANVISKAVLFLFTPIFTRILTPSEYGFYFLYTSWLSVFTALFPLDLSGSVTYRALSKFDGEDDEVLSASLGICGIFSLGFLLFYLLLRKWVNSLTTLSTFMVLLLILEVFLESAEGLFLAAKRYYYCYKSAAFINITAGILPSVIALLIIPFSSVREEARVIGSVITAALIAIPSCVYILRRRVKLYSLRVWRFLAKLSLPLLLYHAAHSIGLQSEKLLISRLLGEGEMGKYSVAYSLGYAVNFISSGVSLALVPWLMRLFAKNEFARARKTCEQATFFVVILTVIFLAFIPEMFYLLAPMEYMGALRATYPIALCSVAGFLSGILGAILLYYEKPFMLGISAIGSTATAFISGYILIGKIGVFGAGISALICISSSLIFNFILANRFMPLSIIGKRSAYQCFALIFFFGLTLFIFRNSPISRILLFFAALMIAIPKLKNLSDIFETEI